MKLKDRLIALTKKVSQVFVALKLKETPWYAKVLGALTVGYALSPIDLIPDFIPVLGYLDDLIILPVLIYFTIKLIPKDIWAECKIEAEKIWVNGKPKKWYYAIPIILIWILSICIVGWFVYSRYDN